MTWFWVEALVTAFWTMVNMAGIGLFCISIHYIQAPNVNLPGKVLFSGLALAVISGYLFAIGIYLKDRRLGPWSKTPQLPSDNQPKGGHGTRIRIIDNF